MNVRISSRDEQSPAQENAALRNEVNNLKEQPALLQEQFDRLRKQVFGRKTRPLSLWMAAHNFHCFRKKRSKLFLCRKRRSLFLNISEDNIKEFQIKTSHYLFHVLTYMTVGI